eukprot:1571921-Rhodomonas_salina.1
MPGAAPARLVQLTFVPRGTDAAYARLYLPTKCLVLTLDRVLLYIPTQCVVLTRGMALPGGAPGGTALAQRHAVAGTAGPKNTPNLPLEPSSPKPSSPKP